jgi:hypothetical protein
MVYPATPPQTPNLSDLTLGKPLLLGGVAVFISVTIQLLTSFGVDITAVQQEALTTWVNQAEIFLVPIITYFVMKRSFHRTAVDLLHTPVPLPPYIGGAPLIMPGIPNTRTAPDNEDPAA